MSNEEDIVIKFDAEISVNKDGSVGIKPKKDNGPVLELKDLPRDSKELARSAGVSVYVCIHGQWHYCEFIGGSWKCWPLGIAC